MATRGRTGPGTADDGSLQAAAIGGDGHAFAELYDRHERRVYGFCLRMLGTPQDAADATQETFLRMLQRLPALEGRELNFAAYALTVARNACYDALEVRKRVRPVGDHEELSVDGPVAIDEDPERAAMLSSTREQVQAANASLPPSQCEVLALREVESLSYVQIGEIIGLKENAVAQLISRARIGLRNAVRGSALASVGTASADCLRAIPLLATIQDGQDAELEELSFLHAHLASCETCRLRREAMQEAGVSYRVMVPVVVVEWLRHATIARAAEFVGADWSDVAGGVPGGRGRVSEDHASADHGAADGVVADRSAADRGVPDGPQRVHVWAVLGGVVLCVLVALLLASTLSDRAFEPVTIAASKAMVHPDPHRRGRRPWQRRRVDRGVAPRGALAATSAASVSSASTAVGSGSGTGPTGAARRSQSGGHRHRGGSHHSGAGSSTPTGGGPPPTTTTATPPPPTTTTTTAAPPTTTTTTTPPSTTPGGPPTMP